MDCILATVCLLHFAIFKFQKNTRGWILIAINRHKLINSQLGLAETVFFFSLSTAVIKNTLLWSHFTWFLCDEVLQTSPRHFHQRSHAATWNCWCEKLPAASEDRRVWKLNPKTTALSRPFFPIFSQLPRLKYCCIETHMLHCWLSHRSQVLATTKSDESAAGMMMITGEHNQHHIMSVALQTQC